MTQLNKNKKIIRILFNFDSFQYKLFKPVINKIIKKANLMNILIKGTIYLPTKKKRFIVLRSPHVYKKSREQFELKTHRRALVTLFDYTEANKQKAKIFINFIKILVVA